MLSIADWAEEKEQRVGSHTLRLLTVDEDKIAIGRQKAVVGKSIGDVVELVELLGLAFLSTPGEGGQN